MPDSVNWKKDEKYNQKCLSMQVKPCLLKTVLCIVVVFSAGNMCYSQSYWKKTYVKNGDDNLFAPFPLFDGNILLEGFTQSPGENANYKLWLLKIRPNGDTLWTKTYETIRSVYPATIFPTSDSGFLIAGSNGSRGGALLKIKANGDTLWTKVYNQIYEPQIAVLPDGNIIMGGADIPISIFDRYFVLLKIDPRGDILWTKNWSAGRLAQCRSISPLSDGSILFLGGVYGGSLAGAGFFSIRKIDADGEKIWEKSINPPLLPLLPTPDSSYFFWGSGNDLFKIDPDGEIVLDISVYLNYKNTFSAILPLPDGNWLIGGTAHGNKNICLMKFNSRGDSLWIKTFGRITQNTPNVIMVSTPDSNFLIGTSGTTTDSSGSGSHDIWLIKITPDGDTLWTTIFGGPDSLDLAGILPTSDGNFLLHGHGYSLSNGNISSWLVCLIDDQYAFKNTLFTFKIPTYSVDTLNFNYTPLYLPSGMTVSAGGTISWIPKTDSVYRDYVKFLVSKDSGRKDTLTFNVFVNSHNHRRVSAKPSSIRETAPTAFKINIKASNNWIRFFLPRSAVSLTIYDINGRLVYSKPVINACTPYIMLPTAWPGRGKIPTGKYLAKVAIGKNSVMKPFLLVH
jgi:hypothetical protein